MIHFQCGTTNHLSICFQCRKGRHSRIFDLQKRPPWACIIVLHRAALQRSTQRSASPPKTTTTSNYEPHHHHHQPGLDCSKKMDDLGIEPRTYRMLSGHYTTKPIAHTMI
ncbi:hypothetical protein BDP55DRAFT_115048 [Colletotrichum godetiae]|uniref:Uncharacterized protein n=1 Tax=Colletotrichum godetiae TaxID=1209918 RepID=A0AAJ0ARC2_9PEZI|nr:uncharacterized protein BDP55DRAFT_115048 [Colletotrichum godetiae]KAK1676381.1 hypothetical protein BDP55DRAFT_115048 [Colletotrichum godetiae]